MRYTITEEDKLLFSQGALDYKYRFSVMKGSQIVDVLYGVSQAGTYGINGESDIRRTLNFTLTLEEFHTNIEEKIQSWFGLDFKFEIGIYSILNNDYLWYPCGTYLITASNTQYNSTSHTLSLTVSDWFAKLNGTRNGQIGGSPLIKIPVQDEDGNKSTLRDVLSVVVKQQGGIENYIIDDIGEFYGMQSNNPDYEKYREDNPDWNRLPYDLEFNIGCMAADEINEITGLYPYIQKYFDVYNNFCCHGIPSCENDPIALDNSFLKSVITESGESADYDIENIRNVTEVLGSVYDIDRMATECTMSGNTYRLQLTEYDKYVSNDYIAFIPNADSLDRMQLQINGLSPVPIYYENTTTPVAKGTMHKDETYVLLYKKVDSAGRFYYLGQYQPHAVCVLTASPDDPVYTKQYFTERYNCKNIVFRVEPDNPFTIQQIGIVLDVKTGDKYENIQSDSVAIENAIYDNIKTSSWNDAVTITTLCIPWLDVFEKVTWQKQDTREPCQYIIKNISHNLGGTVPTTSITMYRFHPFLYDYEIPR